MNAAPDDGRPEIGAKGASDDASAGAPLSIDSLDLAKLQDARLLRALDWWRGLAAAAQAPVPDRAQLDPIAIPDLLPYVILWDVVPGNDSPQPLFRCRLAGNMLDEMRGGKAKGQWLHERFSPATRSQAQADHEAVVRLARPLVVERTMRWVDKPYYKYRRLMLPFTHREAALVAGSDPLLRDPRLADPHRVAQLFNVVSFIGE